MPTMKAAQIDEFSDDLSSIRIRQVPRPSVRAGFVVVKVVAAAVNPVDWKVASGYLEGIWNTPLPWTLGYDFSGVVTETGAGVDDFGVGDEVFAVNWGQHNHGAGTEDEPVGGAFAEYIEVPAGKLSNKPAELSHQQAAAVSLVGITASQGLDVLGAGPGKTVVILGGSGAVGTVAVQLARLRGATVVTTCSPRTMDFVATLGADRIIDYTRGDWFSDAALVENKVDAVFDTVGHDGTFAAAKEVLSKGGSFISIANREVGFEPRAHAPLSFASYFGLANDPSVQANLAALLVEGRLVLTIDEEFPFTDEGVRKLLEKQRGAKSVGKNVLEVST